MVDEVKKNIIDELDLSDLSGEKKEQLLIKMTEAVLKRIFIETIERLNEKDQEEYSRMIESSVEPEKLEVFLQEKIVDYDDMVKKIIDNFKEEMKVSSSL